jgi:transposase
MDNWGKVY